MFLFWKKGPQAWPLKDCDYKNRQKNQCVLHCSPCFVFNFGTVISTKEKQVILGCALLSERPFLDSGVPLEG